MAQAPGTPSTPAGGSVGAAPAAPTAAPERAVNKDNVGLQNLPGAAPTSAGTLQPANTPVGTGQQAATPAGSGWFIMVFPLLLLVVMILMTTMSQRKEKKKRTELLSSLATHDKVQTSGGIIGTVVEIRDDEVVLRVDEVSNTRIRFAKTAILGVLSKGRTPSSQAEGKPGTAKAGV